MSETNAKVITFYCTAWCPDCTRARAFLDKQHVAYVIADIDESPEARAVVEKLNHGMRSVPTIVFPDGTTLVEPSNAQLAQKLGLSVKA
jgi:glutaredoxin